ncbi:MAG: hypothetical protein VXZ39_09870, partial [Planctomycetota bacterium]|nr:hypothetical protein [Planctomycetota bacterium]
GAGAGGMSVALLLADGRRRCGSAAEDAYRALAARCGPLVRLYAPRLGTRAGVAVIASLSLLALAAALSQGLVARLLQELEAPGSLAWNETVRRAGAPRGLSVDPAARRAPYAAARPPPRDPRIFVLGPCSASAPSAAPELLECDARLVRSILRRWDDDEERRERADAPNSKSRGLEQNVALYGLIERSGWRTTSVEEADVIVVDVLPIVSYRASLGGMFEREFSTYTGTEHLERMRRVNDFLVENAPRGVPMLFLCPSMACGRGRFTRKRTALPKGDPRRASPQRLIDVPTSDPKGRYMREEPMLAELRETIRDAGVRVAIPECYWIGACRRGPRASGTRPPPGR